MYMPCVHVFIDLYLLFWWTYVPFGPSTCYSQRFHVHDKIYLNWFLIQVHCFEGRFFNPRLLVIYIMCSGLIWNMYMHIDYNLKQFKEFLLLRIKIISIDRSSGSWSICDSDTRSPVQLASKEACLSSSIIAFSSAYSREWFIVPRCGAPIGTTSKLHHECVRNSLWLQETVSKHTGLWN